MTVDDRRLMRDDFLDLKFYEYWKYESDSFRYSRLLQERDLNKVLLHQALLTNLYVRNTKASIGNEYNVPEV